MELHKGRHCPVELINGLLVTLSLETDHQTTTHITTGTCPPRKEEWTRENLLSSQLQSVVLDPKKGSVTPTLDHLGNSMNGHAKPQLLSHVSLQEQTAMWFQMWIPMNA